MEEQKLLVENAPEYEVVLEEPESVNSDLPCDLEDQLYEEWRDKQWEREQRALEAKDAEG